MAVRELLSVLCLLSVCAVYSLGQSTDYELMRAYDTAYKCSNVENLTVVFFSTNKKKADFTKSYTKDQAKSDGKAAFCIGGITQTFTAVLLAKLLDTYKNVTWDTPINDYVPDRFWLPDQYRTYQLTLKDILAMRSGLGDVDMISRFKAYKSASELQSKLRYLPSVAAFRDKYTPNLMLFTVIEQVVQAIGGDSWQNLTKSLLLQPLGMYDTVFLDDGAAVKGSVANPNGGFSDISRSAYSGYVLTAPATGICTTTEDMKKWMKFLLDDSQVSVLPREALKRTFRTITPLEYATNQADAYDRYVRQYHGLGWVIGEYRGITTVSQEGSLPGQQSMLTLVPSRNLAVYSSFTGDESAMSLALKEQLNFAAVKRAVTSESIEDICQLISQTTKAYEDSKLNNQRPSAHHRKTNQYEGRPLSEFEGLYRNYLLGDVEVKVVVDKETNLTLKYGAAEFFMLYTETNDTFRLYAKQTYWYFTSARHYSPHLYAVFEEEEDEIESVKLLGMSEVEVPVFSRRPRAPYVEYPSQPCSSGHRLVFTVWSALASAFLVLYR
ncbi:uncharacterized protein LOC131957036 [Physella acuta]|uniref:uncharacterized protein LOC131957036 n=1 Tax=Physella acuta TaxID=109671 RepID=UPI0027DC5E86|nr:uncharacterized protein LOC131957036 [Physella acuta]XP_059177723.1 uncharacterized protein LOC131957036 [Physella acuta]